MKKVDCLAKTLQIQRTNFEKLWEQIVKEKDNFNIDEPVLPRKRKVPLKLGGSKINFFRIHLKNYTDVYIMKS